MPPFPILLFPAKSRQKAIGCMEIFKLAAFASTSKKAKNLVISAGFKAEVKAKLFQKAIIMVSLGDGPYYVFDMALDRIKSSMDFFLDIFNQAELTYLELFHSGFSSFLPIVQDFARFRNLAFDSDPLKNIQKYVAMAKSLKTHDIYSELLIQNFQNLEITRPHHITLDDLLLINGERVILTAHLSSRDTNLFLKHWIAGSNVRTQYLSFMLADGGDVLQGIQFEESPPNRASDQKMVFGESKCRSSGFDIRRINGKIATVFIDAKRNFEICVLDKFIS